MRFSRRQIGWQQGIKMRNAEYASGIFSAFNVARHPK
jgi:hypothetical protein